MRMQNKQHFSVQDSKNMGEFVDKFNDVYGFDSTNRTYYKLLSNALKNADEDQISIGEKDGDLKLGAVSKTLAENIDLFIPFALKGDNKDAIQSMANFFKDINGLRKEGSKTEEQINRLFNFEAYKEQGIDDPIGAILGTASVESYGKSQEELQPFLDLAEQIKSFSFLYKNADIPDIFKAYQESPDFETYPAIEQESQNKNSAPQLPDPSTQQNMQSGLYTLAGAAVVGLLALGAKKLHAGHKEQKRRNKIKELIEQEKKPEKDDATRTSRKKSKKKNKTSNKDEASTTYKSTQTEEQSQYKRGIPRVISTETVAHKNNKQFGSTTPQSPALTALTQPTLPDSTLEQLSLNNQDQKDEEIAGLRAKLNQSRNKEKSAKDCAKQSQEKERAAILRADKSERSAETANERAKRAEKREDEATARAEKAERNLEQAEQKIESLKKTIKSKDRRIQEQNMQLKQIPEAERNAYNAGHYQGWFDCSQSVFAQQQQAESINPMQRLVDGSEIAPEYAENANIEAFKDGFNKGFNIGYEKGKSPRGEKEPNDNEPKEQEAKKNEPEITVDADKKHASKVAKGEISPASIASKQESRQKAA